MIPQAMGPRTLRRNRYHPHGNGGAASAIGRKRWVVASMTASHGLVRQLFDEDAFYDTLDDV